MKLIKKFEGCHLEAYPDPLTGGKPYTIGWGSTRRRDGSPFKLGDRLSQQEVDDLLIWQIEQEFLPRQERIPNWFSLNDNQQGAVLSFAYNLGAAFYGSNGFETLSRVLREQSWKEIEYAFTLYRNPKSNVEEGLLRRRLSEAEVFLAGTPGVDLSPAAQRYLTGGRTYSPGARLSNEAQDYLAWRSGNPVKDLTPIPSGRRILYLATPNLQGEDVLEAQKALVLKGASIVADGVFGPGTKAAVERFQSMNGMVADGVVGPQTWDLLLERVLYLNIPYMVGADVTKVQQALASKGYRVIPDGVFGPGTDTAIKQFQASQGLLADGVVGPKTRVRLGIA
ncbi:MAG TPA: peptidoglycan-binding protein [Trichocoleus sp.]